ncbi:MAG: carboxymuconolactone decarboxylase family protein [Tissierellia bacterium]|nr:carboxymuconolactone decarboxylase family protein [Tissierellia bacterium]
MTYSEKLQQTNAECTNLGKGLPETVAKFFELHDVASVEGALTPKMKELIAIGISVAIRCEPCIVSHVDGLIKAGATREEVLEALGVAIYMGGGPSLAYSAKVLACYDEMTK